MITRSRQVALVLTAVLAAGAACQARDRDPSGLSAPPAADAGFTLVASGDVLPHDSITDRAAFGAGGTGHGFRPVLAGVRPAVSGADVTPRHTTCRPDGRGR